MKQEVVISTAYYAGGNFVHAKIVIAWCLMFEHKKKNQSRNNNENHPSNRSDFRFCQEEIQKFSKNIQNLIVQDSFILNRISSHFELYRKYHQLHFQSYIANATIDGNVYQCVRTTLCSYCIRRIDRQADRQTVIASCNRYINKKRLKSTQTENKIATALYFFPSTRFSSQLFVCMNCIHTQSRFDITMLTDSKCIHSQTYSVSLPNRRDSTVTGADEKPSKALFLSIDHILADVISYSGSLPITSTQP